MTVRSARLVPHALCALLLAAVLPAQAGVFRAYLSVSGSDANDCSIANPCRLLPAALAAVNDGGEVWMLDSANFNTGAVGITKSVTILAIPGALASVVANGANGLEINTAGVQLTVRNLSFGNLGNGADAINFLQGASLTVEDCRFLGLRGAAITAFSIAKITVKNSVLRGNFQGLNLGGSPDVTLDRLHIVDSMSGGIQLTGGKMALTNSIVEGTGGVGVEVTITNGTTASAVIDRSTVVQNATTGISSNAGGASSVSQVTVTRSILSGNDRGAVANATGGGSNTLVLDDTTISHNATAGVSIFNAGVVMTRGNNVFNYNFNGIDVSGGTLTPLAGQ
jgi:hypothetical protein